MTAIDNAATRLWDFIDSRGIVRRLVLAMVLWMTWKAFTWASDFAFAVLAAGNVTFDTGAIIAAVTLPITGLQGYVLKLYLDSRGES